MGEAWMVFRFSLSSSDTSYVVVHFFWAGWSSFLSFLSDPDVQVHFCSLGRLLAFPHPKQPSLSEARNFKFGACTYSRSLHLWLLIPCLRRRTEWQASAVAVPVARHHKPTAASSAPVRYYATIYFSAAAVIKRSLIGGPTTKCDDGGEMTWSAFIVNHLSCFW
jgi:hypothetical protein